MSDQHERTLRKLIARGRKADEQVARIRKSGSRREIDWQRLTDACAKADAAWERVHRFKDERGVV